MNLVTVEFPAATQSLTALRSAAYRLIGKATCEITQRESVWVCSINPKLVPTSVVDPIAIEQDFRDLVTDENLREQIASRTDGVRNVILSLAFGALADKSKTVE